ncbi:hypothetical protein VPNG_03643 [Cytospora leucostoma]|uniref:Uncharacterized protein n=1 Tax=Cytospora leucostoma TaxID=1230097 RepID=A0A423XCK7_9PEZI|nr:hypothetical protein VPNG_03643 [Cytospora leucostoma]
MADLPNQRVPDYCPPKRTDETDDDYFVRWKAHRDAWRQQFLDDYYRSKETRLPSPNSEDDPDEDEILDMVRSIEQDIRIENGQPEPGDLPNRVYSPPVVYPPGKSLSEISDYEPGPNSPIPRIRPEDEEYIDWPGFREYLPGTQPESQHSQHSPPPVRKRSSPPAEDGSLKQPAKRRKTDSTPQIPPAGPSTSGYKRKRVQDESPDEPQMAHKQVQAGPKKRKTDTYNRPSLASATSGSKRKREARHDEAHDQEVQASQPVGAKRRRVDATITDDAAGRRDRKRTTRTARQNAAVSSSPRITRARRRQLSGKDAQLFQLGQCGQVDLQGQAHEIQEQAAEAATTKTRNTTKPVAKTRATPKPSTNTKASVKPRAGNNTNTNTIKASVKSRAGNNANTIINAGAKTRGSWPN